MDLAYFRRFGQPVNESLVKSYEKELERKLDGFERLLKKQKYIAGEVRLSFWSRRISDLTLNWNRTSLSLTSIFSLTARFSRRLDMTISRMRSNGQTSLAGGQRSLLAHRGRLSRGESLLSIQGKNNHYHIALLVR